MRKISAKLSSFDLTERKRGAKPQGLRRGRKRLDDVGISGVSRAPSAVEERKGSQVGQVGGPHPWVTTATPLKPQSLPPNTNLSLEK